MAILEDQSAVRTIPFGRPMIGEAERRAVLDVLSGPVLVHGPKSKEFEAVFARFADAPHAVSVSSCTAGLHLSYFTLGIGPGDEVIVPAQTHVATVHAVELSGARPVFVDAEMRTGNIDIDHVEEKISERTKAISVVHFLGMPADMPRIMEIANRRGLKVIEDCALAIGSRIGGRHAGLFGDTGCFSFYPVKQMTTAEGGMIVTRHAELAERLARQRAFGVDRTAGERAIPGHYDVDMLGFNYRMNEIQAAIGVEQVGRLPEFLQRRRANHEYLEKRLRDIEGISLFDSSRDEFESSYYCLSVLLGDGLARRRTEMIESLKKKGVGTSIYYPQPVPHFAYYQNKYGHLREDFPVAHSISERSISLPVGPHLDEEDMEYVFLTLKDVIAKEMFS